MGLTLHRPTTDIKGNSISLEFLPEDGIICLNISKQSDSAKEEKFKFEGEKFQINLTIREASGILAVIRKGISFDKKIELKDGYSCIRFEPIYKKKEQSGFALGLTIKRESEKKIIVGVNWAEAIAIEEWLKFALYHIFTGAYNIPKSGQK